MEGLSLGEKKKNRKIPIDEILNKKLLVGSQLMSLSFSTSTKEVGFNVSFFNSIKM